MRFPVIKFMLFLIVSLLSPANYSGPMFARASDLPVFPGAEGFGTETPAGRGGKILRVTNLSDRGNGSLRAALEEEGARIIVFEISGTIKSEDYIVIEHPNVTVAGQTAPSPGITIRGGVIINTHDVLIQHLRIRPGDDGPEDGIRIQGPGVHRVVLDHLSVSWSRDENVSTVYPVCDVTISNSIISEAIGEGRYGLLIGDKSHRISIIRNLMVNNGERNPRIDGNATVEIINNIAHNSRGSFMVIGGRQGPSLVAVIGNVGIPGKDTKKGKPLVNTANIHEKSKIYLQGNSHPEEIYGGKKEILSKVNPMKTRGITLVPTNRLEKYILANVGARPWDRDSVDKRIIQQVSEKTGSLINHQKEVGGWPKLAVNRQTFSIPSCLDEIDNNDEYTHFEKLLHKLNK